MRPRAPLAGLLLTAAMAVASCSLATSSCQYQAEGACTFCTEPGLRHAPCPTGGVADSTSGTYWYALRALDLGADPARWDAGVFQGLDLDCSRRPDGGPALCRGPENATASVFPEGIDNALAAGTFARVVNGRSIGADLEHGMNAELERGKWGALLVVDGWNGRPDDDAVEVRLLYGYGSVVRPARWDGTDTWQAPLEPDGGLPSSDFVGGTAYVTGGRLVWDRRDKNEAAMLRLEFNAEVGKPYNRAELSLFDFTLVGTLTPERAEVSVSGAWSSSSATLYPNFLSGGDLARDCEIRRAYGAELSNNWGGATPADLPSPPYKKVCGSAADEQDCTQYCGSTSVGLGMTFLAIDRAHVADAPDGGHFALPPRPQANPKLPDCRLDAGR